MSFIRLYSTPEVRVRFTRRAREEFVTHAEVGMHMIGCNPGHKKKQIIGAILLFSNDC